MIDHPYKVIERAPVGPLRRVYEVGYVDSPSVRQRLVASFSRRANADSCAEELNQTVRVQRLSEMVLTGARLSIETEARIALRYEARVVPVKVEHSAGGPVFHLPPDVQSTTSRERITRSEVAEPVPAMVSAAEFRAFCEHARKDISALNRLFSEIDQRQREDREEIKKLMSSKLIDVTPLIESIVGVLKRRSFTG